MNVLLDTCTFLWLVEGSEALPQRIVEIIAAPENEVFLSSVSAWEIALKNRLGHLPLPEPAERFVPNQRAAHRIDPFALDEESALWEARLPLHHKDPFDRMLVSQAIAHGLAILTPDPLIVQYPVRTLW
jgi:PIN domain nuclease of toxin-antitoxin system